ncbi:ABC transporter permease [Ketogulonicigenium vulgare]|uniref:ABC-type nitrate/sulfonate/bicarbonate transport system, permease component n=1 Tax=Ketogulonicigenium vulgare (strain WSH-001) TaxID=759362 RepID=F9Y6V5_KETVW|nr:ABC transporter permease subunit [Ketogulonicigenium vulgare]ADO42786.1 ABC-type nitrate/sulfonate/bicarbonate transport system, permease component [Ketogulonicigenium vulgare Y25]AEM40972.1 ABC-type nitrate/sulfonate/bicarbonate transport system, permease component [Ketogulonicigenium vulgare WSH-001]ALJ81123.1 nitrate ABC transporter permease [Ketogulonicigenium vulgare]ANW33873.1 nitrate ABC transporter permease [Ketogulonicigenium vulgare]AOZ54698.1 nitrate/sulfonate/bicarbonate ABC tra
MISRDVIYRIIAPLLVFGALYLGWEWVAQNLRSILPPFGDITAEFARRPLFYAVNLWATLSNALIGFAFGAGAAVILSVLMVYFGFLRMAIIPVALLLNVTPVVAISPALIVAFGFNAIPHIIVASIAAFFPMLINAMAGLSAIDREAHDLFRALSASRTEIFLRLRLPSSLGHLFAGAKLSIISAMVGSVVSEFMGTSKGLGATIVLATNFLNLSQMWAAIFISALTSLVLVGIVTLIERLVIRW